MGIPMALVPVTAEQCQVGEGSNISPALYNVFFDTENAGLEYFRSDIIQAYFLLTDNEYRIISNYSMFVRPDHWQESAAAVHKITYEEACEYPERDTAINSFLEWLNIHGLKKNFNLIMHANPNRFYNKQKKEWSQSWYDWSCLQTLFRKEGRIFELWEYFVPYIGENLHTLHTYLPKGFKKLDQAAKKIGIEFEHHNAKEDTLALFECWKYYKEN